MTFGYRDADPPNETDNRLDHWADIKFMEREPASSLIYWLPVALGVIIGALLSIASYPLEGGAIAVLSFAPLYFKIDRQLTPELIFGPGAFVFLFHGLGYALGPLGQRYLLGQDRFIESGFLLAQWGAVIGLTVFAVIFPAIVRANPAISDYAAQNKSEPGLSYAHLPEEDDWRVFTTLLTIWVMFIVVLGYVTGAHRRLGETVETGIGLQSIISSWIQVRVVVWFFLGYAMARFRGGWVWFWILSYLIYAVYVFLDGSRGWVVYAMVFSMIGAGYAGVSHKRMIVLLLAFVLIFAPFATIISDYRTFYGSRAQTLSDRLFYFQQSIKDQANRPNSEVTTGLATILDHSTAQTVDAIFQYTPNPIPHAGFDGMERLLYVFMPRFIMPDRPSPIAAGEIACQYRVANGEMSDSDPRCGIGSYTPTVGDGYRRFGWLGIPALYGLQALIFGLLFRWAWRTRWRIDRLAFSIWLIWAISAVWSMPLTDFFYFLLWTVPKYYLFFWGMNWIAVRVNHQASSAAIFDHSAS